MKLFSDRALAVLDADDPEAASEIRNVGERQTKGVLVRWATEPPPTPLPLMPLDPGVRANIQRREGAGVCCGG